MCTLAICRMAASRKTRTPARFRGKRALLTRFRGKRALLPVFE